jgi:hypothetical protein
VKGRVRGGWGKALIGMMVGALASAAVVSAHGGDASVIHACVGDPAERANVRITAAPGGLGDPAADCTASEHALDWSVQGPAGAPGPTGPQGAQGTPGGGPNDLVTIRVSSSGKRAKKKSVTALCPPNTMVVGGGALVVNPTKKHLTLSESTRQDTKGGGIKGPQGWQAKADDIVVTPNGDETTTGKPWALTVTALCAGDTFGVSRVVPGG